MKVSQKGLKNQSTISARDQYELIWIVEVIRWSILITISIIRLGRTTKSD